MRGLISPLIRRSLFVLHWNKITNRFKTNLKKDNCFTHHAHPKPWLPHLIFLFLSRKLGFLHAIPKYQENMTSFSLVNIWILLTACHLVILCDSCCIDILKRNKMLIGLQRLFWKCMTSVTISNDYDSSRFFYNVSCLQCLLHYVWYPLSANNRARDSQTRRKTL